MMTSDARKRLAERTAEQDAHWTHHDPAVRALIAQAEKQAAVKALRDWADAIDAHLTEAPNPSRDMRMWHGVFASNARASADRIAANAQGGDR